ncbi:TetR/AcrR family transcriptional regulator, partial [Mesorhizobium sp. M7A.F.Ca.CA.001.12.2.1]
MQHDFARRSNRDRTEATRAHLIAAARKLFTEKSYSETGTPEIVAAAGVTRGALYHHFADKQALFAAVVEQEAAAVAEEIERASPPSLFAHDALIAGSDAYLAAMRAPGRTRLLLL